MLLTARWVLPVSHPPIENGAVLIEKDRIVWVGARPQRAVMGSSRAPTIDLKDSILLPGLVNAHCHLEHSVLKDRTTPGLAFTEWIKEVTREKWLLSQDEIRSGVEQAIPLLIRGGATTAADHCHPGHPGHPKFPLMNSRSARQIIFWEVLGASAQRARESLAQARKGNFEEGGHITPHSLYAVHEEILEAIFDSGSALRSIHILESEDEDQFFRRQSGPLAVYVQERGGDLSFPVSSPIRWLAAGHRLNRDILVVHGNYLNEDEMDLLRRFGAGVVHCPGSHAFFRHRRFPLEELVKRGIRIGLGTDGLASNEDLSMLREMRLLHENYPLLSPADCLRMATIEGATLLQRDQEIGTLEEGKRADVVAVPMSQDSLTPLENVLVARQISFSMIDGIRVL